MKSLYRWVGLTLAIAASFGMILIPAATPVDAAAGGRQVTIRTYNIVVESFRYDPALYRQLKSKVARLTPAQAKRVRAETRKFEARMKRTGQRVSDLGEKEATEFTAQKRAKVVVTKAPTWLEQWEAWIKALQGALPFFAIFFPAVAAITPIVVFILAIIGAFSTLTSPSAAKAKK
jgi:hypothetical protein